MKILADENILLVREAFAPLGQVETRPAADLTREAVSDCEILLVRSVTKVDRTLLEESAVRFVGTATIGTDHVDETYLAARGIPFASAPGSNATSVAEYVAAALLELAVRLDLDLREKTLGIVGVGNVGSRVAKRAEALGMRVLLNDPPRARAEGEADFADLSSLLEESDFVTLHVPLTRDGPDATLKLANANFLRAMKPGAILINTSRGKVLDEVALREALDNGHPTAAALDVFENEPTIGPATVQRCAVATPHIAGYSTDGKVGGTTMLLQAAGKIFDADVAFDPAPYMPAPRTPVIRIGRVDAKGRSEAEALREIVHAAYPIMADDAELRAATALPPGEIGNAFTRLRKHYPTRREFRYVQIEVDDDHVREMAKGLGFAVS